MEELKAILATVAGLGEEAKWAFFAWLAYKAFTYLLMAGSALIVVVLITRTVLKSCDDGNAIKVIAGMVGEAYYDHKGVIGAVAGLKAKAQP